MDEMWPQWMAGRLREAGHDVEAVLDRPGLRGEPDQAILAAARAERRALVTENVSDFRRLAAEAISRGEDHFGLVLTTNASWPRHRRETFPRLVESLSALLEQLGEREPRNREWWL